MGYIVITGANGFIGCNLVRKLNALGYTNLILADKFDIAAKQQNLEGCTCRQMIDRDVLAEWLPEHAEEIDAVIHLGARTDTAEFNFRVLDSLNLSYSKALWEICTAKQIPFLYASSAATYGLGEQGFADDHSLIPSLKPLNPYGLSKQLFDMFVLEQKDTPPFYAGFKFFNVYGPYEFHKGRMASVVYHAFRQISETGMLKLFGSHHPQYADGEQLRDFVYVEDVTDVLLYFLQLALEGGSKSKGLSGIYNLGTGKARSFNSLAKAVFAAMQQPYKVEYIPTPADIRDKYQYFTEAKMDKLRAAGFAQNFTELESGVEQYVAFLNKNRKNN